MNSEETFIYNKIDECEKKKIEYLEVDNNRQAKVWEQKENLYRSIFRLIQDGYKLRKIEENANKARGGKNE